VPENGQEPDKEKSRDDLSRAADRLRDSAKWLIASFGAAAAVVVAGISLADLGRLSGETPGYRLAIAIAGAAAGVVGVLGALATAMSLAAASIVTLDDLRTEPRGWKRSFRRVRDEVLADPALRPWKGGIGDFVGDLERARANHREQLRLYVGDKKTTANPAFFQRAVLQVEELQTILARLLDTASFLRLQRSFRRARYVIAGWLLLAAIGVLAFVYAVRIDQPSLDVPAAPVAASLTVASSQRDDVAKRLGAACKYDLGAVPVVVLAVDEKTSKAQVVTVPSQDCTPVRLEADKSSVAAAPPKLGG
jgi:hypothetical protein